MVTQEMCPVRRVYSEGRCQDCGWIKRVTTVTFWLTGMKYRVCAECIKPCRSQILLPRASVVRPGTK